MSSWAEKSEALNLDSSLWYSDVVSTCDYWVPEGMRPMNLISGLTMFCTKLLGPFLIQDLSQSSAAAVTPASGCWWRTAAVVAAGAAHHSLDAGGASRGAKRSQGCDDSGGCSIGLVFSN